MWCIVWDLVNCHSLSIMCKPPESTLSDVICFSNLHSLSIVLICSQYFCARVVSYWVRSAFGVGCVLRIRIRPGRLSRSGYGLESRHIHLRSATGVRSLLQCSLGSSYCSLGTAQGHRHP